MKKRTRPNIEFPKIEKAFLLHICLSFFEADVVFGRCDSGRHRGGDFADSQPLKCHLPISSLTESRGIWQSKILDEFGTQFPKRFIFEDQVWSNDIKHR